MNWRGRNLFLGVKIVGSVHQSADGDWRGSNDFVSALDANVRAKTYEEIQPLLEASVRKFLIDTVAPEQEAWVWNKAIQAAIIAGQNAWAANTGIGDAISELLKPLAAADRGGSK